MEILQAAQLIVPIVFTGSNSVGPQVVITLPNVLIYPTKALSVIDEKYGEIDLEGEVLVDITTGSFGTLTETGGATSPDVTNYYIGKGIVTIGGTDVGNVSKFELTPTAKPLPHYTSRLGTKAMDFNTIVEKSCKVMLTMEEWSAVNLQNFLMAA
jgi:hypothetical protein